MRGSATVPTNSARCLEVPANFGLATSFPSRELDASDGATTLEQLGLTPSGVLLCRDLDD